MRDVRLDRRLRWEHLVADTTNAVIRRFTVGGRISTLVGNSTVGYSGDNGAAISAEIDLPRSLAVDLSIADLTTITESGK